MRTALVVMCSLVSIGCGKKKPTVDKDRCAAARAGLEQGWGMVEMALNAAPAPSAGVVTDMEIKAKVFNEQGPEHAQEAAAFQAQFDAARAWSAADAPARAAFAAARAAGPVQPDKNTPAPVGDAVTKLQAYRVAGEAYYKARRAVVEPMLTEVVAGAEKAVEYVKGGAPETIERAQQNLDKVKASQQSMMGEIDDGLKALADLADKTKSAIELDGTALSACTPR